MGESTIETLGPLATIASFMVGVENGWFWVLSSPEAANLEFYSRFTISLALVRERELPDCINNVNNDAISI